MLEGDALWLETLRITVTAVSKSMWQGRSESGRMFYGHTKNVELTDGCVFKTCEWKELTYKD